MIRDLIVWIIAHIAFCTGTITVMVVIVTIPSVYGWLSSVMRITAHAPSGPHTVDGFVPPILTVGRLQRGTVIGGIIVGAAWIGGHVWSWLQWRDTMLILPMTFSETIAVVTIGCAVGALVPVLIHRSRYQSAIETALPQVMVSVYTTYAHATGSLLETMVLVAKQMLPPNHPLVGEWSWMYRQLSVASWTSYESFTALAKTTLSPLHRNILIALSGIVGDIRSGVVADSQTITEGLRMIADALQESENIRAQIGNETNQVRGTGYVITAITIGLSLYLAVGQWDRYTTAFFADAGSLVVWVVFLICMLAPAVGAHLLTRFRIPIF